AGVDEPAIDLERFDRGTAHVEDGSGMPQLSFRDADREGPVDDRSVQIDLQPIPRNERDGLREAAVEARRELRTATLKTRPPQSRARGVVLVGRNQQVGVAI